MSLSIITWNINGLRAAINKGFWDKMNDLKPDIICLQEIKTDDLTMKNLVLKDENFANWELIWHSATRKGYSGTMILANKKILESQEKKSILELVSVGKKAKLQSKNLESQDTPKFEINNIFEEVEKNGTVLESQENLVIEAENTSFKKEIKSNLESNTELNNESNQIKILEKIVGIDNEVFDVEGRTTGIIFEVKNNLDKDFGNNFGNKIWKEHCQINSEIQIESAKSTKDLESMENIKNLNLEQDLKNKDTEVLEEKLEEISISKKNQTFLLLNCYYPQGGRGIERIEYKLKFYAAILDFVRQKKSKFNNLQVILTGDFNTTFGDIDLKRPKENRQTTGCLAIERDALNLLCVELGLVDIFRVQNPELQLFTYWDQITRARERNVGWRIDFFLISDSLTKPLIDSKNLDKKESDNSDKNASNILDIDNSNNSNLIEKNNSQNSQQNKQQNDSKLSGLENFKLKNVNSPKTCKIEIMNQIFGSDHCPVWLEIN